MLGVDESASLPGSDTSGAPNVKGERRCLTPRRTAANVPIFMTSSRSSRPAVRCGSQRLRPSLSAVMTVTGFESSTHAHAPKPDGWHEAGSQGTRRATSGIGSCSICRLAHETSSAPVAPNAVSALLPRARAVHRDPSSRPANEPTCSATTRPALLLASRPAEPLDLRLFSDASHRGGPPFMRDSSSSRFARRRRLRAGNARRLPPPDHRPSLRAHRRRCPGTPGRTTSTSRVDGLVAAGASTEPDVAGLEVGRPRPAQRGFTLQNLEPGLRRRRRPVLQGPGERHPPDHTRRRDQRRARRGVRHHDVAAGEPARSRSAST